MSRIRIVVADIDGTITETLYSYRLSTRVVELLRRLEDRGYRVVLASGNSVPMVAGLARYLGVSGGVVAENGGAVFYEEEIEWLCDDETSERLEALLESIYTRYREALTPSWQNRFMKCSKALKKREPSVSLEKVAREIRSLMVSERLGDYEVSCSKFAIHINPPGSTKSSGVERLLEIHGVSWDEVLAVGDSENDIDMLARAGIGCLVGDVPEDMRSGVRCVSRRRAGEGFIEIVESVLGL